MVVVFNQRKRSIARMFNSLGMIFLLAFPLCAQTVTFSTRQVIDDDLEKAKKNVVVDIDLDGDHDIVCTANPEGSSGAEDATKPNVVLYLNDGATTFTKAIIDYEFRAARGLAVGDLDGDGYPEVIVGNSNGDSTLVWYLNPVTSYGSEWSKTSIGSSAPLNYCVLVTDLDNDGNLDIVDGMGDAALGGASSDDYIRWFQNDGSSPPAFTENLLINYPSPAAIALGDFDSDGDTDIAGMAWTSYSSLTPATDEDVRWWAQDALSTWTEKEIVKTAYAGNDAQAADVDGDGDLDLIGAGYKTQTIGWWANDGTGAFGSSLHTVLTSFDYSRNVQVVDMDGDGDLDFLACADSDSLVVWLENDGSQNFTEHIIDGSFTYAYYVTPDDLDGDGDVDVVGTAQDAVEAGGSTAGQLAWWENGQAEEQVLASGDPAPTSFYAGKVVIDYANGYGGGNTTVFYNHGKNSNSTAVDTGIDHIAAKGFYTITTDASTYSADVDFSYAGIAEWSAINNESDLVICYWNPSTEKWEMAGSSQSIDATNNVITVSGLTSEFHPYSLFTLASISADNSLPVELQLFTYQKTSKNVVLHWQTASETDNLGFEIYRRTDADTSFVLRASYRDDPALRGQGSSSSGQEYVFTDDMVISGQTYFYELRDVSLNGRSTVVGKLSVDFVPENLTRVVDAHGPSHPYLAPNYPNPFNQSTTIEFALPQNEATTSVRLMIFDALGRKVQTLFSGNLAGGIYRFYWNGKNARGQDLPSGNYFCLFRAGKVNRSQKLILLR